MASLTTTALKVARIYEARRTRWAAGLRKALGLVLATVENRAIANLSGAGAPGDYPVPVRTGHLRGSMRSKLLGPTTGLVFNTAAYAGATQRGFYPFGNKNARKIGPRPFLDDAAKSVDAGDIIHHEMEQVL